jgi:TIR domain
MHQDRVPGYEVVEAVIQSFDEHIQIEQVVYDFESMTYKICLSNDSKTCEVFLQRDSLDDLNDYTGSKESKYWIGLESALKIQLSIPMQIAGLIPFSSDIFFEDKQEWERDNGQNVNVSYSDDEYEIFQDGLKELYNHLEKQKAELSHLKLKNFPYGEDQQEIQGMLRCRDEQIRKNGSCPFSDRISVTSRKHLKAAALIQLVLLEKEIGQGKYSETVKRELVAKISKILYLLASPIFERIKVADYLYDTRKDMGDEQSKIEAHDNSRKRNYDVVISFAGEDRDPAERLAELLKNDSFAVFYDKYEEHDLWGKNLYEHLTEIYSKCGKYCVMFLSKHYAAKQWPTLERRAAQEKAFKENKEYILPIRIDDTEIPGILDTVAYQDLREKSIENIYVILKQKLLGER